MLWPAIARLGEGVFWDAEDAAVYWLDIKSPAVHRFTPSSGERRRWSMPEPIGCIARRSSGGFVAAFRSGFAFLDLASGRVERLGNPEPDAPTNRFNDGA